MQKQVKNSFYQVLCEPHSFILWTNKDVNKNVTPHPAQVGGALVTAAVRRLAINMLSPASDLISGRPAEKHIYNGEAALVGLYSGAHTLS